MSIGWQLTKDAVEFSFTLSAGWNRPEKLGQSIEGLRVCCNLQDDGGEFWQLGDRSEQRGLRFIHCCRLGHVRRRVSSCLLLDLLTCSGVRLVTVNGSNAAKLPLIKAAALVRMRRVCIAFDGETSAINNGLLLSRGVALRAT